MGKSVSFRPAPFNVLRLRLTFRVLLCVYYVLFTFLRARSRFTVAVTSAGSVRYVTDNIYVTNK